MGLQRNYLLKMGYKAFRSKFVETTGHNDQKKTNLIFNNRFKRDVWSPYCILNLHKTMYFMRGQRLSWLNIEERPQEDRL